MAENDTHETLLARWLSGDLSEAELKALENDPDFAMLKRATEESEQLSPPPFDANASWDALLARTEEVEDSAVSTPEILTEPAPEVAFRPSFLRRHGFKMVAVAAAIAMLFVVFLPKGGDEAVKVFAEAGESKTVELPDGSEVRLNAGSSLAYATGDWDNNRKLELEGEAFFEVAKGKRFQVQTVLGTVEVLGTSFNVRARDGHFDVNCYTGKVAVKNPSGKEVGLLTAGQGLVHTSQKTTLASAPNQTGPNWLEGEFNFKEIPFEEVSAELERQFNIELDYPSAMKERPFTGGFTTENLEKALAAITIPYGMTSEDKGKGKIRLY